MSHTRLWTAATIIAFFIAIGFVLSVPHTRDVPQELESDVSTMPVPLVTLHDTYKKGVHTITGSLIAQDACTKISTQASLRGDTSTTQNILVEISAPANTDVCLQLPTRANFITTITAPAQLPIFVTVNGAIASTTAS